MAHNAVQENDIEKFTFARYSFRPFYFALEKQYYTRYGSFYVTMLLNLEANYPELKPLLAETGISVGGQDCYPLKPLVDQ